MDMYTLAESCKMLDITRPTLLRWMRCAEMGTLSHFADARLKCLTLQQVQQLARLHHRVLEIPHRHLDEPRESVSSGGLFPTTTQTEMRNAIVPTPTNLHVPEQANLVTRLSQLETKIAVMQEQLTQLVLQWLNISLLHAQHPFSPGSTTAGQPAEMFVSREGNEASENGASPGGTIRPKPQPHPAELRGRARMIPTIDYQGDGTYRTICPKVGNLSLIPDTPEWFDWLASLSSFRFLGEQGCYTAYRNAQNHRPQRNWSAIRTIHNQSYKCYLGVTDRLTVARLEQAAAKIQEHVNDVG